MFRTQDLSQVKAYLLRQWSKILQGRCPVPDFMFGKEVRLGSYSDNGVPPPGAVVSARRIEVDPRAEPQYKERVPYVVVYGEPGARLTDQVVEPKELLRNPELQLNGQYYITKQIIPSLERILQLAGADVKSWFESMPKVLRGPPLSSLAGAGPTAAMKGKQRKTDKTSLAPTEQTAVAAGVASPSHIATTEPVVASNPFAPGTLPADGSTSTEVSGSTGPRPKPGVRRRRGGKGFVTLGPRIERFYQSVNCLACDQRITSPHRPLTKSRSRLSMGGGGGGMPSSASILASLSSILCSDCLDSEHGRVTTILTLQGRLRRNERDLRATVDVCSSCCRGPPQGGCGVTTKATTTTPSEADDHVSNLNTSSSQSLSASERITTGLELVACESIECPVFWRRRKEQRTCETLQSTVQRCLDKLDALDRAEQYERFLQAEQEAFNAESSFIFPEVQEDEDEEERGRFTDSELDDDLVESVLPVGEVMSEVELQHDDGTELGHVDTDAHILDW
ncbi:DNA polymerase zeta [Actinomortierella ambigua]|nr:DNA polymerase zeta [Actinomortierella ambigua]